MTTQVKAQMKRKTTRLRVLRALVGVLLASIALSACEFDVYKLPLPGGADAGNDPIAVKVMFADVLDLVPKSTVKVNDVTVGEVTDVNLDGDTAVVTLKLRNDTSLPDNTVASIRQTSLLGEKFVSLAPPETGASSNPLGNNDVIPIERSGRNPEVEEVLGALSLLLNGGGVAQLKTIAQELNLALKGREGSARSVLSQIDQLSGTLDTSKADIVTAIESLNQLSLSVKKQLPDIDAALAELPSALTSIDAQRADLVKMLQALDDLSAVGVSVIKQSKASTIASLKQLQPVLTQLADAGDSFVNAFSTFYAYPFVDEVVGRDPQVARNLHMGDYTNLAVELNVDLSKSLDIVGQLPTDVVGLTGAIVDGVKACATALTAGNPLSAECTKLLSNQVLIDYCARPENRDRALCTTVRLLLTGLPKAPPVPGAPPLPIPGPGQPPTLPTLPLSPTNPVQGVLPGLSRPATGAWSAPSTDGKGGPTMGQLTDTYDPALVRLLIPGMVTR